MSHNLSAFNEPSLDQLDMSMVLKLKKNLEKKSNLSKLDASWEKIWFVIFVKEWFSIV